MKTILTLCSIAICGALNLKAADEPKKPAGDRSKVDMEAVFKRRDANADGKISKEEFMKGQKDAAAAEENFKKRDKDGDGSLSKEEFMGAGKKKPS